MRTERKFLRKMTVLLVVAAVLVMGVMPGTVPANVLAQTGDIASGTDWRIEASGKLTISSDAGMSDWDTKGWSKNKDKVTSLEVGSGVTEILRGTFQNCTFTDVIIQSGVQTIGESAFYNCTMMRAIQIPDTVTMIDIGAFSSCSALESVALPASLKEISGTMFVNCSSLKELSLHEGLLTISEAFVNCSNLKEITIPSTVTRIKGAAFDGCTSLEGITFLSDTPPALEAGVFGNGAATQCKFVKEGSTGIHVPAGKGDVYKQAWTSWANYITDAAKPVSGTDWGLDGSGKLTIRSNTGMENWKSWKDQHSTGDWNRVNSVEIQSGVTSIGASVFSQCGKLSSITIPNSVTSIGASAFYNCVNLNSITIPDSVTSMGASAFSGCKLMTNTKLSGKLTSIGNDTFLNCEKLSSITIPGSVTSIGDSAFSGCKSLNSITIPDSVMSIGIGAFSGCGSLTEIKLSKNVTTIERDTFSECGKLSSITIPNGVTGIGSGAFSGCARLSSITIPENVRSIGAEAFSGCITLEGITIPDKVTSIESNTFYNCRSLSSVTILGSVTSIGASAFYYCGSLNSITIPESVTSIGDSAFSNCGSLNSITIPGNVTSIGDSVFYNCSSLSEVVMLRETPPTIGNDIFKFCLFAYGDEKAIHVPAGKADAYKGAWTAWAQYIAEDSTPVKTDAEKAAEAKTAAEGVLNRLTVTNATTKEDILSAVNKALSSAGITDVTVTVEGLTKTEATTAASGSIRGTVKVTCKNATETVTIAKTIAKLPEPVNEDAKKVAAAKTEAERMLDTLTVTNATTKENIVNAVNVALDSVGITGVTVTVENFQKTDATTAAAGSIGGTIKITCGNETGTVTIAKTIEKLPEPVNEDAKKVEEAKTAAEGILNSLTVTNATTKENIVNAVNVALDSVGITGVTVTVENFQKTDATTAAAGSIGGTIKITCGNETGTVAIAKAIEKLPEPVNEDAKKVEAAKTEAERILNSLTVANATTEANIINAVNTALSSAGITDVTVTVENFQKAEATTEAPGSIGGTVRIRCGNETDTIAIAKTIAKLPETENGAAEKVAEAKTAAEGVLNSLTVTNATTEEDILSVVETALGIAGITDVTVTVEGFTKAEATTEASGSIGGTIKISCENETDTVTIAKTIAKLPETVNEDAKKVAEAKTAAEGMLNSLTVTNATTETNIVNAVNAALGIAGITDVTVTVEGFTKVEATTEASGSIGGTIKITCGNEMDTIIIAKTIAKLPEPVNEDARKVAEAKTAVEGMLNSLTVTNATTEANIVNAVNAALGIAGITDVTVTVEGFTKAEATTAAAGGIGGTIKLTCGNETDTVTIARTIAKLPDTGNEDIDNEDAKKVAEAKTAAENALKAVKATNATTVADIQSAVNAALNSGGISGVTVTVEGFTKAEATTAAAGSIRGTIKLTCRNETDTVIIAKTIEKLPGTGGTGSMTEEEKASVGKLVKGLDVSEETAAKILAVAKELKAPMETLLIGENTLANHKSEGDIKGSTFQNLQATASKTTAKSVKLTWKKVKGADGYQVYAAKCGKANKLKLVKDIQKGSTYTQKKLKKGTAYRYVVRAYKVIDGKKITIAASKGIHVFTDGGKYGNTKSVKVNKSKVSLKKGRTYKLKASEVKAKKALKKHRKICYESSNEKVATVTSKGVIRAKAKGTCTVYVYAQNGKQKKIKVTVK